MEKKNVNLLNFGAELRDDVITDINLAHDIEVKQILIKASLNLKKHSTYIQVHDLIISNSDLITNEEFCIVNLPGLPIFAAFLITEIHALTGRFPIIIECLKDYSNEGIFSHYKFKRLYDLDRERVQSREKFKTSHK